ncbi:MAG: hypothetical protein HYT79_03105 [Elusimicrobia bacterium]|nr:hypothetical protein [Elusimicrobiota bacterium]
MDEWVPRIGSASLGVVIFWVVCYFVRRFEKFTLKTLTSVIGLLVGGAVVKFVGDDKTLLAWYAIGLGVGFILYLISSYFPPPGGGWFWTNTDSSGGFGNQGGRGASRGDGGTAGGGGKSGGRGGSIFRPPSP